MEENEMITTEEVEKFFGIGPDTMSKYKRVGVLEPTKTDCKPHLWDKQYVIRRKHIIETGKAEGKSLREIKEEIESLEKEQFNADDIIILIIDDDEGCRKLFRDCLLNLKASSDKTLRIFDAADGFIGIEHAIRLKPHIIILDIGLPGIHGIDVYRKLKDHPSTCDSEIVITSGIVKDFLPENAEFVKKPFSLAKLNDQFSGLIKKLANESTSCTGKRSLTDDVIKTIK
jgi:FixJ family two-component response regulator